MMANTATNETEAWEVLVGEQPLGELSQMAISSKTPVRGQVDTSEIGAMVIFSSIGGNVVFQVNRLMTSPLKVQGPVSSSRK